MFFSIFQNTGGSCSRPSEFHTDYIYFLLEKMLNESYFSIVPVDCCSVGGSV